MKDKFIYVFNKDARDLLKNAGMVLLQSNEQDGVYVFAYDGKLKFALADVSYIMTDTLSF